MQQKCESFIHKYFLGDWMSYRASDSSESFSKYSHNSQPSVKKKKKKKKKKEKKRKWLSQRIVLTSDAEFKTRLSTK